MKTIQEYMDNPDIVYKEHRLADLSKMLDAWWTNPEAGTVLAITPRGNVKGHLDLETWIFTPTHWLEVDEARIVHQKALINATEKGWLLPIWEKPLNNYFEHHLDPGTFFKQLLANQIVQALGRTDNNGKMMIAAAIQNFNKRYKQEAWGDPLRVERWIYG